MPFELSAKTIQWLIEVLIILVLILLGFIGGCEYKQRDWDKEKLVASEKARGLEKQDSNLGHRKVEQLGEDKVEISEAKKWVAEARKVNPKPLISCGSTSATAPVKVEKKDEPLNQNEITYFTVDAMQLYDVSIDPNNAGLRGGLYGSPAPAEVTEGFKVIYENNFSCSEDRKQLKHLQERICEKQKLYKQPLSKYCAN